MKNEITYTEHNGYLYPNLELPEQKEVTIGRWGQKHKRFLQNERRIIYCILLTSGKLTAQLAEIDSQAQNMFEIIVNQSKESHGITEKLKAEDPMEWVRQMNSIASMAEEFVLREVVYTY